MARIGALIDLKDDGPGIVGELERPIVQRLLHVVDPHLALLDDLAISLQVDRNMPKIFGAQDIFGDDLGPVPLIGGQLRDPAGIDAFAIGIAGFGLFQFLGHRDDTRNTRRRGKRERGRGRMTGFRHGGMGRLDRLAGHAPMRKIDLAGQAMFFDGANRGLGDLLAPVLCRKVGNRFRHQAGSGVDRIGHGQEVIALFLQPMGQEIFAAPALVAAIGDPRGVMRAGHKDDQRLGRVAGLKVGDGRKARQFDRLFIFIQLLRDGWRGRDREDDRTGKDACPACVAVE